RRQRGRPPPLPPPRLPHRRRTHQRRIRRPRLRIRPGPARGRRRGGGPARRLGVRSSRTIPLAPPPSRAYSSRTVSDLQRATATPAATGPEPRAVVPMADPGVRGRFGDYGGRYVPQALVPACRDVEAAFRDAWADPLFRRHLDTLLAVHAGRATPVTP